MASNEGPLQPQRSLAQTPMYFRISSILFYILILPSLFFPLNYAGGLKNLWLSMILVGIAVLSSSASCAHKIALICQLNMPAKTKRKLKKLASLFYSSFS